MNEAPEVLPDLLHAGVAGLARNSAAIDAMIGLVDVEVLRRPAAASRCWRRALIPGRGGPASLIAYLSLQDPRLLASDLDLLRDLGVNRGAYYESWPWRAATD
jgi:hypothetical protein